MLGQVALEEESGQGDERPRLRRRRPRAGASFSSWRRRSSVERYVMPIVRGEHREAWAMTEPGAGSDVSAHRRRRPSATATTGC